MHKVWHGIERKHLSDRKMRRSLPRSVTMETHMCLTHGISLSKTFIALYSGKIGKTCKITELL